MTLPANPHEREQAEAALVECAEKLRRVGSSCIVAMASSTGHVYRIISAPNATEQTRICFITATKLNLELGELAAQASRLADAGMGKDYLDTLRDLASEDDA